MAVCPVCGSVLIGRQDKKYCSPKCKNSSSYDRMVMNEQFFLKVDRQLKTNRKILKHYNRSGYTTLRKEELLDAGFNPNYFTHYWKNNKGEVYLFCYDFGFQAIQKNEKYLLVKWQSYMSKEQTA
ncbi:MAG: hypothetical protein ACJA2S_003918 [Cyclobacteriaceae bacterium]|jgi:hypothetical protein